MINGNTSSDKFYLWQDARKIGDWLGGVHETVVVQVYLAARSGVRRIMMSDWELSKIFLYNESAI